MQLTKMKDLIRVHKRSKNIALHITEAGEGQVFIVTSVSDRHDAAEAAKTAYEAIAGILREARMEIVHERIFGSLSVQSLVMASCKEALNSQGIFSDSPLTYIQGDPPWGEGFAGVIIRAVSNNNSRENIWTVLDSGVPCGRGWRLNGVTHLVLQNIQAIGSNQFITKNTKHHPPLNPLPSPHSGGFAEAKREGKKEVPSPLEGEGKGEGERIHTYDLFSMSRPAQTRLMIERAERILLENGASYKDVVRTWFYLSEILDWYAEFNKVRNEKYGEFGIMPGPGDRELLLPASTGIAGDSRAGAACAMDLIAVIENNPEESSSLSFPQVKRVGDPSEKKDSGQAGMTELKFRRGITNDHIDKTRPSIRRLTNPSQLDAFRYGSAFARASVVRNGSTALIEVSGTAAIDEHGVSLYPGDIRAQIDCTFDKVAALLKQEDAELKDICSATVFVKQPEFAKIFYEMASASGLEDFPCVCIVADVCREELLFEMDAEAVVKTGVKDLRIQGFK
jgi:enamine deaminase RidA (YjgF/YER057c/UK114 family)